MSAGDRIVLVLGLSAPKRSRARFLEEWRSDLAAARSVGLSERGLVLAVARVAAFLLVLRLMDVARGQRSTLRLGLSGVLLGFVLVITAFPMGTLSLFATSAVVAWISRAVVRWVNGAA